MKITFPHMGNLYIPVKALLEELEVDYVMPPFSNKETLKLGTRFAPESACMPLKIISGNFIQGHMLGADTVLMIGSWGPCRFGYYCEMQREILSEAGYDMDNIILENTRDGIRETLRRFLKLAGGFKPLKLSRALKAAGEIVFLTDQVERQFYRVKPRESQKGEADAVYKGLRIDVLSSRGAAEIKEALLKALEGLDNVKQKDGFSPLKIGIVGEIYGTIDPFASLYLQDKLADLGVETLRMVSLSQWLDDNIICHLRKNKTFMIYEDGTRPYLDKDIPIGGHTRETIGHTVLHARDGFDGVIQLYPLGCMPEIAAEAILPKISNDLDLPILTLVTDEMTGDSGYQTRIEAFLDLLAQRREAAASREHLIREEIALMERDIKPASALVH